MICISIANRQISDYSSVFRLIATLQYSLQCCNVYYGFAINFTCF